MFKENELSALSIIYANLNLNKLEWNQPLLRHKSFVFPIVYYFIKRYRFVIYTFLLPTNCSVFNTIKWQSSSTSERGSVLFFVFLNFSLEFFISLFCSIRSPQKGAPPPRSLAWPAPLMTLSFFSSVINADSTRFYNESFRFSAKTLMSYAACRKSNWKQNFSIESRVASRRGAVRIFGELQICDISTHTYIDIYNICVCLGSYECPASGSLRPVRIQGSKCRFSLIGD